MVRWIALGALVGCGGGEVEDHTHEAADIVDLPTANGTHNGAGWATTAPQAPFEVGPLQAAIFATDPDNDGRRSSGLMVLSDADIPCDALLGLRNQWDLDALIGQGSGFIFALERWSDQGGGGPALGFEGLYLSGYGYGAGGDEYGMYSAVFHEGSYWTTYGGMSWLRITTEDPTHLTGEFFAGFWAGEFDAMDCGDWEEHNYGDTGWYY